MVRQAHHEVVIWAWDASPRSSPRRLPKPAPARKSRRLSRVDHAMPSPLIFPPDLPPHIVDDAVRAALAEDLGLAGALTSQATLPPAAIATAAIVSRERGIVAGLPLAAAAFRLIGGGV